MLHKADLTNCDREKIHLIGSVQSHGYFFAFRLADKTIYHASANVAAKVTLAAEDTIGKSLQNVLGETAAEAIIREARETGPGESRFFRVPALGESKGLFELHLFEFDGLFGIEIEERSGAEDEQAREISKMHRRTQSYVEKLESGESLEVISRLTCRAIRSMIGFDRVMMYRYLPSWDGEVIGEDKSAEAHSFLHHRFPASDIPLPARELYLKNRSRLIVDSSAVAVAIIPSVHYLTRKPMDLSSSKLRAVSQVHLEYLKNMGVRSSFSVAVIVRGGLWGLIACHSDKVSVIPHDVRLACETVASTFAAVATMKEQLSAQQKAIEFNERLRALFSTLIKSANLASSFLKMHVELEELFEATGIALVTNARTEIAGLTPPESIVKELALALKLEMAKSQKSVIAVDNLAAFDPKFQSLKEISCGAVATYSPLSDDTVLLIFRPELLRNITWGGDPSQKMQKRNYQGIINPRISFESWNQTFSGHSAPWTGFQVKGAEFVRDFVFNSLVPRERLLTELTKQTGVRNPHDS